LPCHSADLTKHDDVVVARVVWDRDVCAEHS
jgi:hypothetical protein